eukprot:GHVS01064237.1.p1 GENE.GHVS01064237.1~~GHVS01064237.1.p1  ORF type:complete len:360 (-),score=27.83 GHVS01064237.1:171-1250(-)
MSQPSHVTETQSSDSSQIMKQPKSTKVDGSPLDSTVHQSLPAISALLPAPPWLTLSYCGIAGMIAWLPVHPCDVLKVRLQLSSEGGGPQRYLGVRDAVRQIRQSEGILRGFYGGLSAGLLRQATYTSLRTGLYTIIRDKVQPVNSGGMGAFATKALCGLTSGAVASTLCCPIEVSLVRMQADGRLPLHQRRAYGNVFNAIYTIQKQEHISTLWRGCTPTIMRAMVVNMVQLSSYDQAKSWFRDYLHVDGIASHVGASWTAGFLYCAASLPIDIAKTRMQNQFNHDVAGDEEAAASQSQRSQRYRGVFDTMRCVVKSEGIMALWKGFWPYFCRGGSHTIIMFVLLEQMKNNADLLGYRYT